ncbi:hypothetical protein J7J26_03720 [Candidatus Micrarchaeota archaeon]|nr:hypothetical protein [Candidatus Micrarchaeota archaeon]
MINNDYNITDVLTKMGFTEEQSLILSKDEFFIKHNKLETLAQKISAFAGIYKVDKNKICEAILKFPPFAGLDHERVIRQKTRIGRLSFMFLTQTEKEFHK